MKMKYGGYVTYPGVGEISDMDVYKCLKDHSRLIDRMSKKRMVEMTLMAQNVLMGIFDGLDANDRSWKFYGKDSKKFKNV